MVLSYLFKVFFLFMLNYFYFLITFLSPSNLVLYYNHCATLWEPL